MKRSSLLVNLGVAHGITSAADGDFRTERQPPAISIAKQVHGVHAVWAPERAGRMAVEADAVLCRPGTGAGVLTADCVPILMLDPQAQLGAAVHAGWRGTLANAVASAMAELVGAGARPERVQAVIGPCIRACCYQVGAELLAQFVQVFGPQVGGPERHLDLPRANVERLRACGVPADQIEDLGECTYCRREGAGEGATPRYFSYRRDQTPKRQLTWLSL